MILCLSKPPVLEGYVYLQNENNILMLFKTRIQYLRGFGFGLIQYH